MFVALYEMKTKPGRESDFEKAWAEWTDAIHRVRGSYGSRLHKTETSGIFVAYAQWPSREAYEKSTNGFTDAEKESSRRMRDAVEDIKTLHLMEVTDDRLKPVT
jgi:heme-degrading monooxygenase HmoA